jgi:ATP-dependent DNA helicase DinG
MAKKPAIRVALDLETTGLHVEQDAILEVAAVKFQDDQIVDTFETFVTPGKSIPYRVQRLTGITPEHVAGAPTFPAIVPRLRTFLGDFPIVGHSIPFDAGFLRRWGLARTNPLIDTFELATVLLPSLTSYNLGQVAESLGIPVPQDRHRAMVDTVLAMQVFLALHERLRTVDLSLLRDLAYLDAPRTWPLLQFFRNELRERIDVDGVKGSLGRGSLGDRFAAQLGMDPRVLSLAIARHDEPDPSVARPGSEEAGQLTAVQPEEDQSVSLYTSQEARVAIHDAFTQQKPLLVEVATGGSDYSPALLPALEWIAGDDSRRLVITCLHQQHARRLIETVLPRLQAHLGSQLPVAYLAERNGYLCVHRWFGAALKRTSGELSAEQARGLAKVGLWAQQTLTGERSELTLLPQEVSAWQRIASGFERVASTENRAGSVYQRCVYRRKGFCFVSRAEERVQAARVIVTTHAGLFDDLSHTHSLLSGIPYRLMLDADLLGDENARWNSIELNHTQLHHVLNTIGTEVADGRYQGLLALAAPALRTNGPGGLSTTPTVAKSELDARMLSWFQSLRQTRQAVDKLFECYTALLEEVAQDGSDGGRDHEKADAAGRLQSGRAHDRPDHPLRLTPQVRNLCSWKDVEDAWPQVAKRLQAVVDLACDAEKRILAAGQGRRSDTSNWEESSVAAEFAEAAQELLTLKEIGQRAMSLAEGDNTDDNIYWLRMPPPPPPTQQHGSHHRAGHEQRDAQQLEMKPVLHGHLVQTSSLLHRLLITPGTSTVFAGCAMSVDNSFAFYRRRFGLEDDVIQAVSVLSEHQDQTLLCIPDDVPEPNAPQYQRQLDDALIRLASALEGQIIALFTSYAALRSTYASIKPVLESRGVLVLGQGIDGSPRQLWQVYQRQERVVLLGAGNFWDGFDDATISPACLFITRLPMPSLNDPPVAARAEQYSDQLHHLTVPMAALRIRRALNRLIWNDTKRNTVVLFDRRVLSKEYGSIILNSIPRCSQRQVAASRMPEVVLDFPKS